jgi:glyoxylase-like metal-dependent hydrolase (beta-lactamase superfamily II)
MFGNAPRQLWSRWVEPDEHNRIPLACRALLVEEADRKILFESGIGAFFPPAMRERFGVVEGEHVLLRNLAALGVQPDAIDVVVLSHLHFDHAGGLLSAHREGRSPELLFERARFVIGREAWQRASQPHLRDRRSFAPEIQSLLAASARVELVDGPHSEVLGAAYRLHFSSGHTPGLMMTEIPTAEGPLLFASDLIPGTAWVHLPITMGYDRFPELLIEEKQRVLDELVEAGGWLYYTHDPAIAASRVERDERGHYRAVDQLLELRGWPRRHA